MRKSADMPRQCRMCASLAAASFPWDKPLLESENFVAVPSIGSLVPGWLLVLPRAHYLSLREIPRGLRREYMSFVEDVSRRIIGHYGKLWSFQHGPSLENLAIGCGVDHAHLHLLPIDLDLRPAVAEALQSRLVWHEIGGIFDKKVSTPEMSYLFYSRRGVSWVAHSAAFGSQLFRRAVARKLGRPGEFSWREYPQLETVERTIADFRHPKRDAVVLRSLSS